MLPIISHEVPGIGSYSGHKSGDTQIYLWILSVACGRTSVGGCTFGRECSALSLNPENGICFLSTTEIIVDSHAILVWAAVTNCHGWLKQ